MREMPTINEAAAAVPCSHWTIRRYLRMGIVEAVRDGNRLRLKPGSIKTIRRRLLEHGGPGGMPLRRPEK